MSTATRFDSAGTLVDSAIDSPRFDYGYDGTSWINQGLLVEKQSTNLLANNTTYTVDALVPNPANDISNNHWFYSGTSSDDSGMRRLATPDASMSILNGNNRFIKFLADTKTNTRTFSILAKPYLTAGQAILYMSSGNASEIARSGYTLANTSTTYRLKVTGVGTTATTSALGTRYTLTHAVNLLAGFAQLEDGGVATSTIKTSGSAVTRSQDNLQLNLSNYTGSIKLTYKRQDTEVIETKWIDLTNSSNPNLSDYLDVRGLVIRN
ncbi:phage head spike fiber domain-containing protein [Acinetobacter seifertii]|uniref:phage head spike fiber domain-containing protein n=1 Tax=Acinetobacter seifertii TaxID=1530123 RepID=UPI0038627D87